MLQLRTRRAHQPKDCEEEGESGEAGRVAGSGEIVVKIRRLTDELVMVEMKNKQRDVGLAWADELRRKLRCIINQPVKRGP